jgi:hypothetical protein
VRRDDGAIGRAPGNHPGGRANEKPAELKRISRVYRCMFMLSFANSEAQFTNPDGVMSA